MGGAVRDDYERYGAILGRNLGAALNRIAGWRVGGKTLPLNRREC